MDKKAWVHQLKAQVAKQGADAASWYVSWTDPAGKQRRKSCGPGKVGKSAANRLADTTHSQLVTGTYAANERATRDPFFERYTKHIEGRYDAPSRKAAMLSIRTFIRVAKPKRMRGIDTAKVDEFIGKRLKETGNRKSADGRPLADFTRDRQPRVAVHQGGSATGGGLGFHRQGSEDAVPEATTEAPDLRHA